MPAELRTDDEELDRCDTSTAQPCGCNKQTHDGEIRIEKQAGSTLSADAGTKVGIPAQKMWELLTRFGCHKSAGRAVGALENV